jgi:hypothetical protein
MNRLTRNSHPRLICCCLTWYFTGLCVVCVEDQQVHTGISRFDKCRGMNALLSNVILYWPMCYMRQKWASTHYTWISQFDKCGVMSTNRSVKQSNSDMLFASLANALLPNGMLYWPMCCMHSKSAGTYYADIGQFDNCRVMSTTRSVKQSNSRHAICSLSQCAVVQCNASLAYVLYA